MKRLIILFALLVVSVVFLFLLYTIFAKKVITTYDQCVQDKSSYLLETYPATCITSAGRHFTQPLTSEEQQKLVPPTDPTFNWSVYTSRKFGYSFRYPSDWNTTFFDENTSSQGTNTVRNYDPLEVEKYMNHGIVDYKRVGRSVGKVEITILDPNQVNMNDLNLVSEQLVIGNLPTKVYRSTTTDAYNRELLARLPNGKALIVAITVHNLTGSTIENDLSVETDQILSTFQFTQ